MGFRVFLRRRNFGFYVILFLCLMVFIVLNFYSRIPSGQTSSETKQPRSIKEMEIKDDHLPQLQNSLLWSREIKNKRSSNKDRVFSKGLDGFLSQGYKAGEAIPMYIVDEHHGVIPYWYGAADSRVLPHRHGNTLIHIDAHSDFANPEISPSFPLFRWPTRQDWSQLMQENDMFIVAAALTEMFSRMVWVYPDWDSSIDESYGATGSHSVVEINAGQELLPEGSVANGEDGKYTGRICACVRILNKPKLHSTKWTSSDKLDCVALVNLTQAENDQETIERTSCHLLNKTARAEYVQESKLLELLGRKDPSFLPIDPKHGWILDIDEDFFGVEAAVLPLYNAHLSDEEIDNVTTWVTELFCGRTSIDELAGDLAFQMLIQFVRHDRKSKDCQNFNKLVQDHQNKDNDGESFFLDALNEEELDTATSCVHDVFKYITRAMNDGQLRREKGVHVSQNVFCAVKDELDRVSNMTILLSLLYRMNDKQLEALADVGICFWSSIAFEGKFIKMRVCDGFNRPNSESMVEFHTPTVKEVRKRGLRIKKILEGLSKSSSPTTSGVGKPIAPQLITVCRSARDGYVPRSMLHLIETSVVHSVQSVFGDVKPVKVMHDSDLIGGVDGWVNRFRLQEYHDYGLFGR